MAPIHDAAHSADFNALRRLLDAGVSPNDRSGILPTGNSPETPTILVCCSGSVTGDRMACLRLLRDTGANLGATDIIGYTPLHHSALRADVEMVSLLIQAGVNVNAGPGGFTPLAQAAQSYLGSAYECAELLVKAGAAVNVEAQGWTPLDIAINRRHYRMWPLLLRAGAEVPGYYSPMPNPYLLRVQGAGGFEKYAQDHLARITPTFASMLRLPAQPARRVAEFWLHAGYY